MDMLAVELPRFGDVEIGISSKNLFVFAYRQFLNYKPKKKKSLSSKYFVRINAFDKLPFIPNIAISKEIILSSGKMKFTKKLGTMHFVYQYSLFSDRVEIDVTLVKRAAYPMALLKRGSYGISHLLFYNAILFPIFSLYALYGGYYLLHGSALKIGDKNVIISGMSGVGKSSLSLMLISSGAVLLSDNFILFNGGLCMPLSLPMRLEDCDEKVGQEVFHGNNHIEMLFRSKQFDPLEIDLSYLLAIVDGGTYTTMELGIDAESSQSLMISNGADEISEANSFSSAFLFINKVIFNDYKSKQHFPDKQCCQAIFVPKGMLDYAKREILCQVGI